jgi:hypothetical protein
MRTPLFGLGQLAKSPTVTAKRLQNLYCEARPQGEKSALVAYATPGLSLFVDFGATPIRGGLEVESTNLCYVVHRGVLWEVNNAGVKVSRGLLATTTGRVSMVHNGLQVMIVDGVNGYIYNTSTTAFAQITDPDFPANPTTVTFLARRFVVSLAGSSRFYWSDIDDGLAWDALSFANAEASPDPIVMVFATNGQLALHGTLTTEFWGISGAEDQPFTPLQGTTSEWGLAARWSIAKYDNTYACLIKNRMGQVMVAQLAGYLPKKISTIDIDSIINAYPDTADASAYSYMLGGHPMFVITFPAAGFTWLYDGSTGIWSSLKSLGIARHLGELAFSFLSDMMVADYSTGLLYKLRPDLLADNGASIERQIVGETVTTPDGDYISVDCLRVDMEVGVGLATGQGSNPQIGLEISRDNGRTWGAQMWRTFGAVGQYSTEVEWRRLGTAKAFTPRLTVTDPVPVNIVSASLNPRD